MDKEHDLQEDKQDHNNESMIDHNHNDQNDTNTSHSSQNHHEMMLEDFKKGL